ADQMPAAGAFDRIDDSQAAGGRNRSRCNLHPGIDAPGKGQPVRKITHVRMTGCETDHVNVKRSLSMNLDDLFGSASSAFSHLRQIWRVTRFIASWNVPQFAGSFLLPAFIEQLFYFRNHACGLDGERVV